jgi:hypothetical protein
METGGVWQRCRIPPVFDLKNPKMRQFFGRFYEEYFIRSFVFALFFDRFNLGADYVEPVAVVYQQPDLLDARF